MFYNAVIFFYTVVYKAFDCGFNAERRLEELKVEIPAAQQEVDSLDLLINKAEENPQRFFAAYVGNNYKVFCQKNFDEFLANLKKDRQLTASRHGALVRERRWIMRFNKAHLQTNSSARHLAH